MISKQKMDFIHFIQLYWSITWIKTIFINSPSKLKPSFLQLSGGYDFPGDAFS